MDLSQIALSQMIKGNQFTYDPPELDATLRAEAYRRIRLSIWSRTLGVFPKCSETTRRILRTLAQMAPRPGIAK